jgi:predicted kinase
MLVVFGGLPGTGKTTISRALATRSSATFLRIDEIEQALRSARVLAGDVGPAGYVIGNALAASNLAIGRTVIVDCVNPVQESRLGWRATAKHAGTKLLDVEVVCSDRVEHRRRVEQRVSDIAGLALPDWRTVLDREYAPWDEPHVVVDTARLTALEAVEAVERHMSAERPLPPGTIELGASGP